jgi:hypothetical protein
MLARRLLFARTRRGARPAATPIAICALVALSLLGFVLALWPDTAELQASRPDASQAAPAGGSLEGGLRALPDKPESRKRSTWM